MLTLGSVSHKINPIAFENKYGAADKSSRQERSRAAHLSVAIDEWDATDLCCSSENGIHKGYLNFRVDGGALSPEALWVSLHRDKHIQVAWLPSPAPHIALPSNPQPAASIHSCTTVQIHPETSPHHKRTVIMTPIRIESSSFYGDISLISLIRGTPKGMHRARQMVSNSRSPRSGKMEGGDATPAGTRREIFLLFRTRPSPPHVLHGVDSSPCPSQLGHCITCAHKHPSEDLPFPVMPWGAASPCHRTLFSIH